uniref:Serine/threonine-protein kinase n=1 Tax=Gouania willdenowi TaxID=441366 RepID=A0A8C5GV44_GOUWI
KLMNFIVDRFFIGVVLDNLVNVKNTFKDFKQKYREFDVLGKGSFGSVMSGVRLSDLTPVAIKHISIHKVDYMRVIWNGYCWDEVSEVVYMAQAAGRLRNGSEENCSVIGLIDVYDLKDEVLIIMEQPVGAMDIRKLCNRGVYYTEHQAKCIFKQLVDAVVLMHKNGIFHRDIKADNILVYLKEQKLSIKIIDFGCSDFVRESSHRRFAGTLAFAPPELFMQREYYAEPTTVWEIGRLLLDLYSKDKFHLRTFVKGPKPHFDFLSDECNDFINQCLTIDPKKRPSLIALQCHPWLV